MSLLSQTSNIKTFSLSEKLTIIQQLIDQLRPQNVLRVLVNDDPMIPNQKYLQESNTVHTYELLGSKSLRKTQNNNLYQKLEAMHKDQSENRCTKNSASDFLLTSQLDQADQKDKRKPVLQSEKAFYRYFSDNIKCFRCKKAGHYDFACLDEFSCNLCLSSEHQAERCPQKIVCFRCYDFGHMLNQCPFGEDGPFCHNCKRKHFDKCGFLMKGTEQVKQMFIMDGLYFDEDIRCLKCFGYNHFNCEANDGNAEHFKRPYQAISEREKFYNNKKHKY